MRRRDNPLAWAIAQRKQGRLPRAERRQFRELYRRLNGPGYRPQKTLRYL